MDVPEQNLTGAKNKTMLNCLRVIEEATIDCVETLFFFNCVYIGRVNVCSFNKNVLFVGGRCIPRTRSKTSCKGCDKLVQEKEHRLNHNTVFFKIPNRTSLKKPSVKKSGVSNFL